MVSPTRAHPDQSRLNNPQVWSASRRTKILILTMMSPIPCFARRTIVKACNDLRRILLFTQFSRASCDMVIAKSECYFSLRLFVANYPSFSCALTLGTLYFSCVLQSGISGSSAVIRSSALLNFFSFNFVKSKETRIADQMFLPICRLSQIFVFHFCVYRRLSGLLSLF